MKYSIFTLILGLFTVLSAAAPTRDAVPTRDDDNPDSSQVYIEDISYGGTGCKPGSVAISKSNDGKSITLAYDSFVSKVGPGVPITENRKNCNYQVKLHYPPAWQYALHTINIKGHADIQRGTTVTEKYDVWFASLVNQRATIRETWDGPLSGHYSSVGTLAPDIYVWSPCGVSAIMNINHMINVSTSDPQTPGFAGPATGDDKSFSVGDFKWRKC